MKRIFTKLTLLAAIAAAICSCGSMDDVYKEYIEDGPSVNVAKPDGVEILSGVGRVQLSLQKSSDPRVKGVTLYWDNRTEKRDFEIGSSDEELKFIVDGVAEGSHIFEVICHDKNGGCNSLPVTVTASSYGETFISSIVPSGITSATVSSSGYCSFSIRHSSSYYYQYMEITYESKEGGTKTMQVMKGTNSIVINDFTGDSFTYKSFFLPEATCIDVMVSDEGSFSDFTRPQISGEDKCLLDPWKGVTDTYLFSSNWSPVEMTVEENDWLTTTLEGNTIALKVKSMNGTGAERSVKVTLKADEAVKEVTITQHEIDSHIGTLYYENGAAVGIVIKKDYDNPGQYKIISCKNGAMAWSKTSTTTNASGLDGTTGGVDNNEIIMSMADYETNNYAVSWVKKNLGSEWHLPSFNEYYYDFFPAYNGTTWEASSTSYRKNCTLEEQERRGNMNDLIVANGGSALYGSDTGTGTYHWTCCESDETHAWILRFGSRTYTQSGTKTNSYHVRGMKTVTIND